ncbi:MAG: PKD domain-containing protein [Thermoplasmata archaeon]|nr:PKD domain-containing protein [Thermoplasmata archaeon]
MVGPGNVTSPGSFVTIHFTALSASGTTTLTLYDVRVTNESEYIESTVHSASVTVTGGSTPPPSEPPSNPPGNEPPLPPVKPDGPTFIELGTAYVYSSAAVDPGGGRVRLRFDWGDGSFSNWTGFVGSNTSVAATHAWENDSTYPIRVIAQDTNGSNSSWSDPLTVVVSQAGSEGSPPVGEFSIPQNASSNQSIVFDASGSYDPDGVIVSYQWDFGDGVTGVGENPVHTYQFPGEYTVTLTVTDNAGMTFRTSQVVSIAAGSLVPTEKGNDFLQSNSSAIILIIAAVTFLILFLVFRNKIQELFLQKRIETSQRNLAQFERNTTDIDQIVDSLFLEMKQKTKNPSTAYILNAYSDLIIGNVEKNAAFHVPDLSIVDVERIVDGLIHSKIVAKLEKI